VEPFRTILGGLLVNLGVANHNVLAGEFPTDQMVELRRIPLGSFSAAALRYLDYLIMEMRPAGWGVDGVVTPPTTPETSPSRRGVGNTAP